MASSYGSAVFRGLRTGMTYYKDIYLDDTAGNLVRWDAGSGANATSATEWVAPEPVALVDFCIASATGQTKTQLIRNQIPTGDILRNALQLSTVTYRPVLRVPFQGGVKIQAIQLA